MCLDEILASQKRGESSGIASICSAHPFVLGQVLETFPHPLIEATCNQVNQFGGYTGMRPRDFVAFVRRIALEHHRRFEDVTLGGDHLGPFPWRSEPASRAMAKAKTMVASYARAGFTKLHLDCSMRLANDPAGPLDQQVAAQRAAELATVAEQAGRQPLRYVIGTDVPRPGGVALTEMCARLTEVNDARETLEVHRKVFCEQGLGSVWKRTLALVVQPGAEFGDDSVMPYAPEAARGLSKFIEDQPMVYEAHSTDYQTRRALKCLVQDHFAILKVGPALTFAYRESIFALAMIENEWISRSKRSNFLRVLEHAMIGRPQHWRPYYRGTAAEQAFKRKFSLSDRVRYYWVLPEVQRALNQLLRNLGDRTLPFALSSQFLGETGLTARRAIELKVGKTLEDYSVACDPASPPCPGIPKHAQ